MNRNNIFTPMLDEYTLINNILISFNRKRGNAFYLNQCTPGSLRTMCRVFFIKKKFRCDIKRTISDGFINGCTCT